VLTRLANFDNTVNSSTGFTVTISSANRKAGPFFGNGATTEFPFGFKVFKKEDVKVTFTNSNGVDAVLVLDSDYSVELNTDQDNAPGGVITYPRVGSPLTVLENGERLTLTGALPYTQPTDIPNNSPFFAQIVEDAFDRAEIQIQQLKEESDRAIKISVSDQTLNPLPTAGARANTVIGFDALGNVTVIPLPSSVGAGDRIPFSFVAGEDFTPDVTTQLILPRAPGTPGNIEVYFDAMGQDFTQWTVNGLTLSFGQPIPAGVSRVWGYIGTTLSTQVPPIGSVGDQQLVWAGILSRVVDSVAVLRQLDKSKYNRAFVTGYDTPGDGGGGSYYYDPLDVTSADNGGTVLVAADGGRWKLIGRHTVKTFGAKGDGNGAGAGTDDTARVQAYLNFLNNTFDCGVFPPGYYNVRSLTFTGLNFDLLFDNATLYGIASTPTDALVDMVDFATHRVQGLQLQTDGNKVAPVFHGNYTCALRIRSSGGPNPTQWVRMQSPRIRYFRQGVVNGNHVGQPPQPFIAQSEIWIDDYQVRGVNRPFFGNAINSYLVFTNSGFVPQKFESSSSWWVDADGWCARNDDGRSEVLFIGCEFQRAIQSGYALYGLGMTVVDPVWEVSCPTFVAGDMTLKGGIDNHFGAAAIVPFQVAPFASGVFTLDNFKLEREPGTANFDETPLIDATGNNSIRIRIDGRFMEWQFNQPNGVGDLIRGGRLSVDDLFVDNSTGTHPSFEIVAPKNTLNNADRVGNTFPTSGVTAPTGGWTVTAGAANGAYAQSMTTPPPGASCWLYAETSGGGGFTFETSGTSRNPIQGGRDAMLDMWVKVFTFGAGASWQTIIEWRDFSGALVQVDQIASLTAATYTPWSTGNGMRLRAGVKVPWQAASYIVRFTLGPNTAVGVNDISILQ
jgi:hypothetical protein